MANKKKEVVEDAVIKEEKVKETKEEEVKETVRPKQKDEKREEEKDFSDRIKDEFTNAKDHSKEFSAEEKKNGKGMSILAYIGILCLIPYFAEKNNKYVQFHAKQGLNLCILSIIASFACAIIGFTIILALPALLVNWAIRILTVVLMVIGIINVCKDEAKELPIVNKFKIVK